MPTPSKKEQAAQSAEYSTLINNTKNFLELYKQKHAETRWFASWRENSARKEAAQLIERLSCHIQEQVSELGSYDEQRFRGPDKYYARHALCLEALKGALYLTLLNLKQEYNPSFYSYSLSQHTLFSLSLNALGLTSIEEIPAEHISNSLRRLNEYLTIMSNNKKWDEPEVSRILSDIKKVSAAFEAQPVAMQPAV